MCIELMTIITFFMRLPCRRQMGFLVTTLARVLMLRAMSLWLVH